MHIELKNHRKFHRFSHLDDQNGGKSTDSDWSIEMFKRAAS